MILNSVINNVNLGDYIKEIYDVIDIKNPINDNEKNIFNEILIDRITMWLGCEVVYNLDEISCVNYLKKFIRKRIVDLVVSLRQFIIAINNKNISGTHIQTKFNPLDNSKDINDAPVFDDKLQFTDFSNYLNRVEYLENIQVLKDWSEWVNSIIINY